MPESREGTASYLVVDEFFTENHDKTNLKLLALYADASEAEEQQYGAQDGHVFLLKSDTTVKRGSRKRQTPLFPQQLAVTAEQPNPPSISSMNLVLQEVASTSRAIVLNFGELSLKLAYLTHTSVQIYPKEVWNTSVLNVSKKNRGFHVGLALEFEEYVLAFPTNDMMFQPEWSTSFEDLCKGSPDVYTSYSGFLKTVADWIEAQAASGSKRTRLACEAVRNANDVWGGVGVYTVCEIFFDAGISPFLLEREVFDCPSRTARLCEAFWAYAHTSHTGLKGLLDPCRRIDGILAPTTQQRLHYKDWLHVYGKEQTKLPPRAAQLVDLYKGQLGALAASGNTWFRDATSLYDPFEPEFIRSALLHEHKLPKLGHLIFGDEWEGEVPSVDPLTCMFKKRNLVGGLRWLKPGHYVPLFDALTPKLKWKRRDTFTYYASKQIWSIVPNFPPNSQLSVSLNINSKKNIRHVTGTERETMLFAYIVTKTRYAAIGPLEYCGHGKVVRTTHQKKLVSIVRADPALPAHLAIRELQGINRKRLGLDKPGRAKRAMTAKERRDFSAKRALVQVPRSDIFLDNSSKSFNSSGGVPSDPLTSDTSSSDFDSSAPPLKKRRLSQDKHIAAEALAGAGQEFLGRRRRK
ncbi:hypothetical protein NLJ89_g6883 [Agrocybe chaxingu]|uniref:Uncharacterized protein n=1 Tax=Agrocybe chaxingu TaxID=84603 RepID=A0A9W8K4N8_9AGAR|nr:hypothetical protein NLJ89_g6883 [Agrocybe chaxingu]